MENSKQMELEMLIAIRDNQTIPADEFYKIFDECWPDYKNCLVSLHNTGLLIKSRHDIIPGLKTWKLTNAGNYRITDLLLKRSNDLSERLTGPKKIKKLRTFRNWNPLRIADLVSHVSLRLKRAVH
jgi:hypothetical protein